MFPKHWACYTYTLFILGDHKRTRAMSFSLLTLSLPTYRGPCVVSEKKTEKDPSFKELKRTSIGQGVEKGQDLLSILLYPYNRIFCILFLIFFINNNLEYLFNSKGNVKSYIWISFKAVNFIIHLHDKYSFMKYSLSTNYVPGTLWLLGVKHPKSLTTLLLHTCAL